MLGWMTIPLNSLNNIDVDFRVIWGEKIAYLQEKIIILEIFAIASVLSGAKLCKLNMNDNHEMISNWGLTVVKSVWGPILRNVHYIIWSAKFEIATWF